MDCRLQVFKLEKGVSNSGNSYRFAVVDYNRSRSYPANFVCMLPIKVELVKGKETNKFGILFGDKSLDFAMNLLSEALKNEENTEVKTEIKRRLKLIDPNQVNLVKCSVCNKNFKVLKKRNHRQNLCPKCLKGRFAAN